MRKLRTLLALIGIAFFFLILAACAAEVVVETTTPSVLPTQAPTAILPRTPTAPAPTPTPFIEERFIEVEWPSSLRLGDSDIIRLALIPSEAGYSAQLEYPEHTVELEDVDVPYVSWYEAVAIARMDAVGMDVEPKGDLALHLLVSESIVWRWTIYPQSAGRHRLGLSVRLRWEPLAEGEPIEKSLWQTGLEILVEAPLGLTVPQARALGIAGVLVGSVLALPLAEFATRKRLESARAKRTRRGRPNRQLLLETGPGIEYSASEETLIQAVFDQYARVTIETRFASGYSGARTLLIHPIRPDGRADAYAILKIGSRSMIQSEYANYQSFVRHTLPPITGRVLGPPVVVQGERDAALQYTFVGTPGVAPESLRSYTLNHSASETAGLIEDQLFATFGPAWWMQRQPYTFRILQEYDRLLPVHLLLETTHIQAEETVLGGELADMKGLKPGAVIRLEEAHVLEVRPQRKTVTLNWPHSLSGSTLRVRFQNVRTDAFPVGKKIGAVLGRIVASRRDLLEQEVRKPLPSLDLSGDEVTLSGRRLPNPLNALDDLLHDRIRGTRSVIHGDLNLENILVGPGDLVWLIDFGATREGHTVYDFARLEVEITTQVVAETFARYGLGIMEFLDLLDMLERGELPDQGPLGAMQSLLGSVRRIAQRCMYDPADMSEFRKALILAYLGSLKFANLDELETAPLPKALAFTAAATLMGYEKMA
jgi:hypothetical protein